MGRRRCLEAPSNGDDDNDNDNGNDDVDEGGGMTIPWITIVLGSSSKVYGSMGGEESKFGHGMTKVSCADDHHWQRYLFIRFLEHVLYFTPYIVYWYIAFLLRPRCDFGFGLGLFSPVSYSGVWLSIEYILLE
jgi:hypothetical protein